MYFRILWLIALVAMGGALTAQKAVISGKVSDALSNESIPFANIIIEGKTIGVTSDLDGTYRLEIEPGIYNLSCSFIGYKTQIEYEVMASTGRAARVDFQLEASTSEIDAVEVKASPFSKTEESPVSLRTISAAEIYRNPGANRDISRVVQSLPGVATTPSFRNDIIVRGGAPNENRFFLDGIEIANINHFATQGSSGGPVGMLNVNLIDQVQFYSGAFPSTRGNAMSSVMELNTVTPNTEQLGVTFSVGSSDAGLTLDGALGSKGGFLFSARRSYLQFLFTALSLPFLPTYNDFMGKLEYDIDERNKLTFIGLGAIDSFELNLDANNNLDDQETIDRNNYILGNLPMNEQWNYAIGGKWQHFRESSFSTLVISQNKLQNSATKYQDNIEEDENLLLDYLSTETETKARFENSSRTGNWKVVFGGELQWAQYTSDTYQILEIGGSRDTLNFTSELGFARYGGFAQASRSFANQRLVVSLGARIDGNSYSSDMSNPLAQFSPRASVSYSLTEKLSVNANAGLYYQLPPYTVLGFRNSKGDLINKANGVSYIQNIQGVFGFELAPTTYSKISLEGFFKQYDDYPFLLNEQVTLANLGADFGVIGNAPVSSTSSGRSYGLELLGQQKLSASLYGILSYTYVISEFEDAAGNLVPSSWDNRHIFNLTAGKKFAKNWELGLKFRFLGGAPYTPLDAQTSAQIEVWDVTQQGVLDWSRLNAFRYGANHGLDFRVDKRWFFPSWSLNVYLDVENAYNFQFEDRSFLDVVRDENGEALVDPDNPEAYLLEEVSNSSGTVLPSIGLLIEF